jgi:GTPase SAR1 family protein
MALPQTKTPPKKKMEEQTILLYGPPKIGKSSLASQFDNPLFLATEAGLNSLEVFQIPIPTWDEFLTACKDIAGGKHEFKTIVIDTVDNLFKACAEFVRKKNNIQHESDLEWGKGWQLVKDEFSRALTKLSLLPYGLVMISHSDTIEIKTRTAKITKQVPTLNKSAREIVLGMSDIILYAESTVTEKDGEVRIIRTKPSENYEAGDRTGRLPAVLPLDFKAFYNAFYGIENKKGDK